MLIKEMKVQKLRKNSSFKMSFPKRHQNRIKGLKKEIPFYGELSTSDSKGKSPLRGLWSVKEGTEVT